MEVAKRAAVRSAIYNQKLRTVTDSLLCGIVIITSFFPRAADACTEIVVPKKVPPSFIVDVVDRGKPVPNVVVSIDVPSSPQIRNGLERRERHTTDENGRVRFENVPNGFYGVRLEVEDPKYQEIEVDSSLEPRETKLTLNWPGTPVIRTQRPAGEVRQICKAQGQLQDCALQGTATLVEAKSSREIGTVSLVDGRFDLGTVAPGIYFLRLRQASAAARNWDTLRGDVALEVDANAPMADLQLDVGMTSCGLYYSESCSAEPLAGNYVCGRIVDMYDAAVANAQVRLNDQVTSETRAVTRSNAAGEFSLPRMHQSGDYTITFLAEGFTVLRSPVHIVAGETCGEPIRVTLGVAGACGQISRLKSDWK